VYVSSRSINITHYDRDDRDVSQVRTPRFRRLVFTIASTHSASLEAIYRVRCAFYCTGYRKSEYQGAREGEGPSGRKGRLVMIGTTKGKLIFAAIAAILLLAFYATSIKTSLKTQPLSADHAANKGAIHHVPPRAARQTGAGTAFYALHMRDIKGHPVSFADFKGKVVMVVNVASHDVAKTDGNYKDLQQLQQKYGHRGLEILAFPCNQFGDEEAGSNHEINEFATRTYGATFRLMSKIDVNGPETAPLYRMLKTAFPGKIKWNFQAKFLVDKHGNPVKRSSLLPHQMEDEIVEYLQQQA